MRENHSFERQFIPIRHVGSNQASLMSFQLYLTLRQNDKDFFYFSGQANSTLMELPGGGKWQQLEAYAKTGLSKRSIDPAIGAQRNAFKVIISSC